MSKVVRYSIASLALVFFCTTQSAHAKVYKWVDENGAVHFTDKPPRQLKVEPEVVEIKPRKSISTARFRSIARLQAIRNPADSNSKSVLLERLSVDYDEDSGSDTALGKTYKYTREASLRAAKLRQSDKALASALPCTEEGKLNLNNARYISKQVDFSKPFNEVFEDNGYAVTTNKTFAMQENARNDLSLAASVIDIQLSHCGSRRAQNLLSFTQNSTYLKIEWTVFDNLARKVVFKTSSEGIDDHFNEPPRYNGAAISWAQAFRQATEHLLAQPEFVEILKASASIDNGYQGDSGDLADMNLVYGKSNTSFVKKTSQIEKASVTIRTAGGHGSGFVISTPGYILTNNHVVAQNSEVIVIIGGKELRARVLRSNAGRDVALLKLVERFDTSPMQIEANDVSLGEEIYVVGTPLDERLDFSISRGIISAKRLVEKKSFYQTDAAVNPGNSGGPVFNSLGNVIGVTVAGLFTRDGGSMNINYVIPIADALDALQVKRQ